MLYKIVGILLEFCNLVEDQILTGVFLTSEGFHWCVLWNPSAFMADEQGFCYGMQQNDINLSFGMKNIHQKNYTQMDVFFDRISSKF